MIWEDVRSREALAPTSATADTTILALATPTAAQ